MKTQYTVICVPLDTRGPSDSPDEFEVALVCEPRFPQGEYQPQQLAAILAQHPILKGGKSISARAKPFAAWQSNPSMTTPDVVKVTLTHKEDEHGPLPALAAALLRYMGVPHPIRSDGIVHDQRFDLLSEDKFVDIAQTYDAIVDIKRRLHRLKGVPSIQRSDEVDQFDLGAFRRLDSAAHAAILDSLRDQSKSTQLDSLVSAEGRNVQAQLVQSALRKIEKRLTRKTTVRKAAEVAPGKLLSASAAGERMVSARDPNISVHAALRNGLMASACGFVTKWKANSGPISGDWVMEIDLTSIPMETALADVVTRPTAFRRREFTHPLAYRDLTAKQTGNCGFVALNDPLGTPRYRASCINTEAQLVKDFIVQANNSLSDVADAREDFGAFVAGVDTRRPQLLRDEQLGSSEPETSGIVFSAPVEDLVTQPALRPNGQGERIGPGLTCNFLEDLWIGFRLDLSTETGPFHSVHVQRQRAEFFQGHVEGGNEDFFDREQAADESREITSTEFATYNGMSTAQARDMRIFLGLEDASTVADTVPLRVSTVGYSGATRLEFGQTYRYRLRAVFLGCVSLPRESMPASLDARYVQPVPFFRAHRYKAGEVVRSSGGGAAGREKSLLSIQLTDHAPTAKITLAPAPIDIDTCRYYGLVLGDADEARRLSGRRFVKDAAAMFADGGTDMNYFYDPEVSGVVIRAKVLNGRPRTSGAPQMAHEGQYCEVIPHLPLKAVRQKYGDKGDWKNFRPIVISFRTTDSVEPSIQKRGLLFDCHHVEVSVPPAVDIELSIIPDVDVADLMRTASFASSSAQLDAALTTPEFNSGWIPTLSLTDQVIRVVHAVPQPLRAPELVADGAANREPLALRAVDSETAEVPGHVEVHAASTGQVRLQASWTDIDDAPEQEIYALNSGLTVTKPHSVVFGEVPASLPRGLKAFVSKAHSSEQSNDGQSQCAENKVFLGGAERNNPNASHEKWHALNFKDFRRKIATVSALTRSRFESAYGPQAIDVKSSSVVFDVPSTARMKAPRVSHILPLGRTKESAAPGHRSIKTEYAFRIFLERPWFQSGPGERLAIGCLTGPEPNKVRQALDKTFTQWGEDPVERPGLVASKRIPRASDFVSPATGVELDPRLYPIAEERHFVLHRDNVQLGSDNFSSTRLSLASYAVAWDRDTQHWYCDVVLGSDFFGWCGLALYRHQPSACLGRELSEAGDWAYAAVIHGDPIAWVVRAGEVRITVGPSFDPYSSFELDAVEFRDGVSENLHARADTAVELKRYQVGRSYYFEAAVPYRSTAWSLTKRRFGYGVASIPLNVE